MRSNLSVLLWVCTAALLANVATLYADTIELVNGDVLNGQVVSLDTKQLQLVSDVHGKLSIARDKVATIALGERKLNALKPIAMPTPITIPVAPNPAVAAEPAGNDGMADLLKQLRAGEFGPAQLQELEKGHPLLKGPEARKYFDKTVAGLTDGSISVADVRKDAIRVRDQLREVTKELGPEAQQALGSYFTVLDKFIRDSEPAVEPPAKREPAR